MFELQIFNNVEQNGQPAWDALSAGQPFTSYNWYHFGERAMADCAPTYLVLSQSGQPQARATFWKIADEPLPIPPLLAKPVASLLKHWPLLICRSPLANASGLILPDSDLREPARQMIAKNALELLQRQNGSFAIFDFLTTPQTADWPKDFTATTVSDPGTFMPLNWPDFEAWLDSGNKKDRQHYKRTVREAEKLGLSLTRHTRVERIEEALTLIRNVERRHDSAPNPWVRGMLENMAMVNGTYLTVTSGERLVGCGLLLEDNGAQTTTALGLAEDVPYVYFMLIYESLKLAFEHQIRLLRWGSGAYEVKQRLGFSLEDTNHAVFSSHLPCLRAISHHLV